MAIAPKVLAQKTPAAGGAFEDAYTVGGGVGTTIATIILHNDGTSGATDTAQIRIAVAGAADNITQQIWNVNVPDEGSIIITTGITLEATDVVRVASTNGDVNFHFYGIEES
jgi:hypothetical protein